MEFVFPLSESRKNCSESFWMFWNHSEWFRMLPSWFSKLKKCLELNRSHNRWSTRIYKGLKTKPIVKNDSHETKWYYCHIDFRERFLFLTQLSITNTFVTERMLRFSMSHSTWEAGFYKEGVVWYFSTKSIRNSFLCDGICNKLKFSNHSKCSKSQFVTWSPISTTIFLL